MQNPLAALGLSGDADAEQVRAAYHQRVKRCHPDAVQGIAAQQTAQEELVRLNLLYKEAMHIVTLRDAEKIVIPDARPVAAKLFEQGHLDSALRILGRAKNRDAEWFRLYGQILMKKGEPEAAHISFRTAVHMDPENGKLRELALSAAVEMRKQKTLRGRVGCWARGVIGKMQ